MFKGIKYKIQITKSLFITIILRKKFEKSKIPDCFFFSFDVTSQNVVCENLIYNFGELAQLVERLVRNQ